jgi:hypothetical protein
MTKHFRFTLICCLLLAACARRDSQAEQLDRAASQSDPAAAAELHNQADAIRESGSDANVADPASPAQAAMQSAGNAAAGNAAGTASNETKPR